jgi:hypothetical protein
MSIIDSILKSVNPKCPQCGADVFLPVSAWRSNVPDAKDDDVVVMCSDMGHWIGTLKECLPKKKANKK